MQDTTTLTIKQALTEIPDARFYRVLDRRTSTDRPDPNRGLLCSPDDVNEDLADLTLHADDGPWAITAVERHPNSITCLHLRHATTAAISDIWVRSYTLQDIAADVEGVVRRHGVDLATMASLRLEEWATASLSEWYDGDVDAVVDEVHRLREER